MAQALFKTGQQRILITCLQMHHPIRMKACLRNGGHEQISPRDNPKHLALGACCNPRHKECGRSTIDRPVSAACHLMQTPEGKSAPWKSRVDLSDTEGQDTTSASLPALKALDAGSKLCNDGIGGSLGHSKNGSFQGFAALCEADMFIICSDCFRESIGPLGRQRRPFGYANMNLTSDSERYARSGRQENFLK